MAFKLHAYPCLGFMELQDLGLWDLWGWHRVTFLGDFKKDVEALAKKIGYRVIYES